MYHFFSFSAPGRLKQEDGEFEATIDYIVRPLSQKKRGNNNVTVIL
jgi:hypothetical protein